MQRLPVDPLHRKATDLQESDFRRYSSGNFALEAGNPITVNEAQIAGVLIGQRSTVGSAYIITQDSHPIKISVAAPLMLPVQGPIIIAPDNCGGTNTNPRGFPGEFYVLHRMPTFVNTVRSSQVSWFKVDPVAHTTQVLADGVATFDEAYQGAPNSPPYASISGLVPAPFDAVIGVPVHGRKRVVITGMLTSAIPGLPASVGYVGYSRQPGLAGNENFNAYAFSDSAGPAPFGFIREINGITTGGLGTAQLNIVVEFLGGTNPLLLKVEAFDT